MADLAFDFQDPSIDDTEKTAALASLRTAVLASVNEDIDGPAWSTGEYGRTRGDLDMERCLVIRDAIMAYGDPFTITVCG